MKPHPTPPKGGEHELARANYALYIVNYELTTIQHSTFNIKNYTSCIVHYELTTIQHSTFNIKNYTSCIVHYELNKFDITDCAVAF